MRAIIGAVFFIGAISVFTAVTAVVFIVQHAFAVALLSLAAAALILLARGANRRGVHSRRPPTQYPGLCAPARTTDGGLARRQAPDMSSAAIPSRARRSLERRSYP
jgi:hypothetical protein